MIAYSSEENIMHPVLKSPQQDQPPEDNKPTTEAITLESKALFDKEAVTVQLWNRTD